MSTTRNQFLVVDDIVAAREDLISRGVDVSEVEEQPKPPGFPDLPGRSYFAYASFSDPDGNGWVLQEVTTRLPGGDEPAAAEQLPTLAVAETKVSPGGSVKVSLMPATSPSP